MILSNLNMSHSPQSKRFYNNKPSFGMNINIVTEDELRRISINEQIWWEHFSGPPWTKDTIVINKDKAYTEAATCCNVVGITNGKEVFLAHLIPNIENMSEEKIVKGETSARRRWLRKHDIVLRESTLKPDLAKKIEENILRMKNNSNKRLTGFITGGVPYYRGSGYSMDMFESLNLLLKKHNVATTIAWGQTKSTNIDLLYSVAKDTLNLTIAALKQPLSLGSISNALSIFKFNFNDKVFIDGCEVGIDLFKSNPNILAKLKHKL